MPHKPPRPPRKPFAEHSYDDHLQAARWHRHQEQGHANLARHHELRAKRLRLNTTPTDRSIA